MQTKNNKPFILPIKLRRYRQTKRVLLAVNINRLKEFKL